MSLFKNQTFNSPKLIIIHKILKTARRTMANKVILNRINIELFATNIQKKQQAQYTGF